MRSLTTRRCARGSCPSSTATTRSSRAARGRGPSRSGRCRPLRSGRATSKATVTVSGNTITERDANSSLVTTWTVAPSGAGSTVTTSTEWKGAGGIGGFFERTFAPLGLRRIQEATLANLQRELA
ncbi:hypothetical protein GS451_26185 [Rhodococcus hoagii]|nr:hypothetical protein [Prescottella equi]